ncbi:MAG: primosomal protein N' [Desulfovibrio sp.]|nr:primosomal protein N' [Desulfovibrio sp.]
MPEALFLQIALLSAPYSTLTYLPARAFPDSFWQKGLRVLLPLGRTNRPCTGILLECRNTSHLSSSSLKAVLWPLEAAPLIPDDLLSLFSEMAAREGGTFGRIAASILPQGLRSADLLLQYLEDGRQKTLPLSSLSLCPLPEQSDLARALIEGRASFVPTKKEAAERERFLLAVDPPWPVRPKAVQQKAVLEFLYAHGTSGRKALREALSPSYSTALKELLKAGHVRVRFEDEGEEDELIQSADLLPPLEKPFSLNGEQEDVVGRLGAALSEGKGGTVLLYGVTGSGKTAVYLDIVRKALGMGRSAFLLVPEVALALKLLQDTKKIYPDIPVIFYHGYQSQRYRERVWKSLGARPVFVLGTRSALFLPAHRIGVIILDEEHDASFKQEDGLHYHAKDIAWLRAHLHSALLVLGSATPDIRTFYAAQERLFERLDLPHRIRGQALPPIELIDVREKKSLSEAVTLLAKQSLAVLEETVARGEQAVLLINRRGFAPHMYCTECGKTERCPDCEIGLTYHKAHGKLICHYCGYTRSFPAPCSGCGANAYLPLGEGTERVAEELEAYLGRRVLRLDRDSTRREGQMEAILHAFAREESPVLVGTQMLSKGHHFPKVTLVIAADADQGLNIPDYRASERTFQLLLQSAGRAGRDALPGRVLLQTRDTSHYVWPYILAYDYEGFFAEELARRKKHAYPPFAKIALIRLSFLKDDERGHGELASLSLILKARARALGLIFLGPAPSPLSMLRGRKRYQCLVKSADWPRIRELYESSLKEGRPRNLRTSLDLDPMNML